MKEAVTAVEEEEKETVLEEMQQVMNTAVDCHHTLDDQKGIARRTIEHDCIAVKELMLEMEETTLNVVNDEHRQRKQRLVKITTILQESMDEYKKLAELLKRAIKMKMKAMEEEAKTRMEGIKELIEQLKKELEALKHWELEGLEEVKAVKAKLAKPLHTIAPVKPANEATTTTTTTTSSDQSTTTTTSSSSATTTTPITTTSRSSSSSSEVPATTTPKTTSSTTATTTSSSSSAADQLTTPTTTKEVAAPTSDHDGHQSAASAVGASGGGGGASVAPLGSNRSTLKALFDSSKAGGVRGVLVWEAGVAGQTNDVDNNFHHPIGCTHDPIEDWWIVCDTGHNLVKVFAGDGAQFLQIFDAMDKPSAVAVLDPGRTIVVKDEHSVVAYDLRDDGNKYTDIATKLKRPMGLAVDGRGHVVVMVDCATDNRMKMVTTIDPRSPNRPFLSQPLHLPPTTTTQQAKQSMPLFLDAQGDLVAITDCGLQCVYMHSLANGGRLVGSFGAPGHQLDRFSAVSAIRFDDTGAMIIGDLKAHNIRLFSAIGTPLCLLELDQSCGVVSDLHVSHNNRLIVTDHGASMVRVYQLSAQ